MSESTMSTRTRMTLNCARFWHKDPMALVVAADEEAARVEAVVWSPVSTLLFLLAHRFC